jgi:hypothetical protein
MPLVLSEEPKWPLFPLSPLRVATPATATTTTGVVERDAKGLCLLPWSGHRRIVAEHQTEAAVALSSTTGACAKRIEGGSSEIDQKRYRYNDLFL